MKPRSQLMTVPCFLLEFTAGHPAAAREFETRMGSWNNIRPSRSHYLVTIDGHQGSVMIHDSTSPIQCVTLVFVPEVFRDDDVFPSHETSNHFTVSSVSTLSAFRVSFLLANPSPFTTHPFHAAHISIAAILFTGQVFIMYPPISQSQRICLLLHRSQPVYFKRLVASFPGKKW